MRSIQRHHHPGFVFVFAVSLVAGGCAGEIVSPYSGPPGNGWTTGTADGGHQGDPVPDGGMPQGDGCPSGQHKQAGTCVPDEITCAEEFPCPMGMTCSGGRCITVPGPCATNDDCPAGDVCVSGMCQPAGCGPNAMCKTDKDCPMAELCVACSCVSIDQCKTPTADISGAPWSAHQILHLDEALGSFGKVMVGILKKLRDGVLGCKGNVAGDCFLYQIIASFLPNWAKTLIVAVGNFGDVIDNHQFIVDSQMTFTKNGKPSGYHGKDHWLMLSFHYQNMQIMKAPKDVPQIGHDVTPEFEASGVCGVLYVDKHKVEGVLSGILKWILDTVIEVTTCNGNGPCYHSLGEAIDGAIDCNKVNDLAAKAACIGFKKGLKSTIDNAVNSWLLSYSLMTLKGTAIVNPNGKALEKGHWDGTLGDGIGIFNNFDGEWSAMR